MAPGDVGVVAAVDVVAGVFVELQRVATVWRDRQRVVSVGVRVGPSALRGSEVVDPDGPEGRVIESVNVTADLHAERHRDVDRAHVQACHRHRCAGVLLVGREVAIGDVGVIAAVEVVAGVVVELQGVVAVWRDRQRVVPVAVRVVPSAETGRVGVDVDVLQGRRSVGSEDVAGDAHAERHLGVDPGRVAGAYRYGRAGVPIDREAGGAMAAVEVGPSPRVVIEPDHIVAGQDRDRVVAVAVRIGPGAVACAGVGLRQRRRPTGPGDPACDVHAQR